MISRRLLTAFAAALLFTVGSCRDPGVRQVVLYSSVDDYLLREVIDLYEDRTGVKVRVVGDTEATKTTGLIERLLAERDRPRADVWWSSEPFGTIRLSREGLLDRFESTAEAEFADGWPAHLRDTDGYWYGFASRARVLVWSSDRLTLNQIPRHLEGLTKPEWRGRVGMAQPEFGTTRGHMGALVVACGLEPTADWMQRMRSNNVRLYPGNAAVVRAVAEGEIDLGLTDTDDVFAAQRNGWAVDLVYEQPSATSGLCSPGPLLLPNTIAKVRGAPNGTEADKLIDFILSEETEALIAASDSRNFPVRDIPTLVTAPETAAAIDLNAVADAIPEAMRLCRDRLGSR